LSEYDNYTPMAAKWLLPDGTVTDKLPIEGGAGGVPEPGSITTEMFAPDAKAPLAGVADSASAVTWANVSSKPTTFAPTAHQHTADDINTGTLDTARIPALSIAKVTGLQTSLDGKINKSALSAVEPIADPETATAEDIAVAFNALLAALKG